LDKLSASPYPKKVLVLHDFDAYGFWVFGTLGADTRRYKFANAVPMSISDYVWKTSKYLDWSLSRMKRGNRMRELRRCGSTVLRLRRLISWKPIVLRP
jgi:hypothetical protein